MAASGALTGASMVWTAGQDGWKPAAETELARLLAQSSAAAAAGGLILAGGGCGPRPSRFAKAISR
ncbi:hypothetical protein MASR1M32_34820 [Rhodobacter sp.]